MVKLLAVTLGLMLSLDVCGYKPAGKGKRLPANLKTLAVPIFKNTGLKFRVEQRFTTAVIEEILKRARGINVVTTSEGADAVFEADLRSMRTQGIILDNAGRTRVWNIRIIVSVTVRDLRSNRILFNNQRMSFEGEYELSEDPRSFFNEENPAVERIARDFAQSIISTIMEGP
jgi:hypothetical protein